MRAIGKAVLYTAIPARVEVKTSRGPDTAARERHKRNTSPYRRGRGGNVKIMLNSETTAQTRLNAADAIIRNSLKMGERTDVLERIAEIEKTLGELEDERR